MKISSTWMFKIGASHEDIKWFLSQKERDSIVVVKKLMNRNLDLADWLMASLLTQKQLEKYSTYSIGIDTIKFPEKLKDIIKYGISLKKILN